MGGKDIKPSVASSCTSFIVLFRVKFYDINLITFTSRFLTDIIRLSLKVLYMYLPLGAARSKYRNDRSNLLSVAYDISSQHNLVSVMGHPVS